MCFVNFIVFYENILKIKIYYYNIYIFIFYVFLDVFCVIFDSFNWKKIFCIFIRDVIMY